MYTNAFIHICRGVSIYTYICRGRRSTSSSSSGSGVHGSAQRLKQGLELERCALGQPQIVDIPARTLQIQCFGSPVNAPFHTHPSSQCVSVSGRERKRERERARERERDREREGGRERERARGREGERESERERGEGERPRETESERERERERDYVTVCPSQ
jgi:hypothetical protein